LGFEAERGAPQPGRAGAGRLRGGSALRRAGGSQATLLVRLPAQPGPDRVLDLGPLPAPRPGAVPPGRTHRAVDGGAALPVTVARTVVVGGGISGLTVARTLKARGLPVLLLEAAERLGGRIRSELREGFVLEAGPNGFLDRDGSVARLAEELGISD